VEAACGRKSYKLAGVICCALTLLAGGEWLAKVVGEDDWCGRALLEFWARQLESKELVTKRMAVQRVGHFGARAAFAVPALGRMLDDPDIDTAISAVVSLGQIGAPAASAIPSLARKLSDERFQLANVRHGVPFRPNSRPVATALARIGEASIPALLQVIRDCTGCGRAGAAAALGLARPAQVRAVPALIEALKDKDRDVRRESAQALGRIGHEGRRAVPALEAALNNEEHLEDDVEAAIVSALTKLGAPPIAVLQRAIREKKLHQVPALSLVGSAGESVLPSLLQALKDPEYDVRLAAFEAVCRVDVGVGKAIPALIEYLQANRAVECHEAVALHRMGESARPVVPVLLNLIPQLERDSAIAVIQILPALDPDGVVSIPSLVKLLVSDDFRQRQGPGQWRTTRGEICVALGIIGPAASDAVPILTRIAMARDDTAREEAIEALGRIGPAAGRAVNTLSLELANSK
jgi:HEAT repeat protein